ncbi:MAG: hypothetical protein GQ574_01595 [Crocinitomix sp.]|nr:hypothetical protein [Crocinitomix sp.]
MDTNKITKDKKVILSALWVFATLNYLYCDLLGLMDSVLLNQYLVGEVNGMTIDQNFLLAGAILMEIPIAMVLLSLMLKYKANRWTNIIAGSIKTIVMILTMFVGPTSYYIFFGTIEITTTIFIVWYAWNWSEPRNSID